MGQERVIASAIDQLNSGLTRVHVAGVSGPGIRIILRSRPDLFMVTDKTSASGSRAYNVALRKQQQNSSKLQHAHADRNDKPAPVGGYRKAINPFQGGFI